MSFDIKWIDSGREPQVEPNPNYPNGIDVDTAGSAKPACFTQLPYPARRIGQYLVTCRTCGLRAVITTAGRADDPRSVTLQCIVREPAT